MDSEKGQGLFEYALILILAFVVVVALMMLFLSVIFPLLVTLVEAIIAGNATAIAVAVILIFIVLYISRRR